MMFHFPEPMRNKLFPKINKWFEKIMKTPEAMKAYGRTILCKNILKPFNGKIERNKGKEENKKENKGKHDKKEYEIKTKDQVKKDETKEEEPYVPGLLEIPRFNIKEIENNPLDSLPASKFDLKKFKQDFLKNYLVA